MGESLGSRPEELYAEHKSNAERLDEMQRRLDAARVLSDILTPEQIQQLGSADFDAKMQHENTLKEATKHYEENRDAYVEQAGEELEDVYVDEFRKRMQYGRWVNENGHTIPAGDFNFAWGIHSPAKILAALPSPEEIKVMRPKFDRVVVPELTTEQIQYLKEQRPDIDFVSEGRRIGLL